MALAVLPVRSNRVELYEDRLVVVYAGTRSAIPYTHVRGVRRTRSLWAGTANSLDRVLIEAPWDGDAIVSVKDNDALVDEPERRCGLRPGRPRPAAGTHEMADVHGSRAPPETILRPMEKAGTANEWGVQAI